MLSDHERKTLLDIEHRLLAEDPNWALAFVVADARMPRRRNLRLAAYVVAIVLAVALTVLMMAAHAPGPAVFFAVVSGSLMWLIGRLCRPAAQPGGGQPGTGAPQF